MKLQCCVTKSYLSLVSSPVLVRQHQILAGVCLNVLVGIYVRDNGSAFIFEHLASLGMVIVVVAVEQVPDWGVCDLPDLSQHLPRVINIHGVNDHDALAGDHEHGDDEPVRGETVDIRSNFSALRDTSSTITFLSLYQRMSRDMTK